MASRIDRLLFFGASFGSIAILLAHLVGAGRMDALALNAGLPSGLVMAAVALKAWRCGDRALLAQLRAGLIGGLLGTLAYDVVRVPVHLAGLNPLSPIRAYGFSPARCTGTRTTS